MKSICSYYGYGIGSSEITFFSTEFEMVVDLVVMT